MQQLTTTDLSPQVLQAKQRLGIIGNTPSLNEAVQRAIKVAPIDLSVLITGESGTGKEFFPKIIHQYSSRKHSKYIAVNCGAIPEGTIESELFGHEKGSFTGAVASRKGYFEEADGGTIFLDEVAELPLTTQARLLRVLETGEFLKVGSSTVQRTNIRVVAATNVDMQKAVAEHRFREDLYYRLSTVQISIPPLRDRGLDIIMLAKKFAATFAETNRMPKIAFTEASRQALLSYRWPGNVRQLKNVVEQLSLFEAGKEVDYETLRQYLPADAPGMATSGQMHPAINTSTYEREREMLLSLIFRLQQEIADLRKEFEDSKMSHQDAPSQNFSIERHLPTTIPHHKPKDPEHEIIDISPVDDTPATAAHNGSETAATRQPESLRSTEIELIRRSLERNHGNRKATASELKISERTLYRKIKEYDLE